MKMLEKVTEGAGIAVYYAGGMTAMWGGGLATLIALGIWGVSGLSLPLAIGWACFGGAPLAGGIYLFRRGKILKDVLKVKLQKETVRKLAFTHHGRLRPSDLAAAQGWTEDKALNVLKYLAAEDSARIELQLDYESGEIYFDFPEIQRALNAQKQYQALPLTDTLAQKAVEMSMILGKTIETFQEYMAFSRETVAEHREQKHADRYRHKIERFLQEIDELKQQ